MLDVHCDERTLPNENPEDYVTRVAVDKALAGQALLRNDRQAIVIGADTSVLVRDQICGKPKNKADAFSMWSMMSGATHHVLSAVAVIQGDTRRVVLQTSEVMMRLITPQEQEWYWESGEPRDKAGAYAVQGLGAIFISRLTGSYTGVMGLPLFETAELLSRFNVLIDANAANAPTTTERRQ